MLLFFYLLEGLPGGAAHLQTNETISAWAEDCCSTHACSAWKRGAKAKQNFQGKAIWRKTTEGVPGSSWQRSGKRLFVLWIAVGVLEYPHVTKWNLYCQLLDFRTFLGRGWFCDKCILLSEFEVTAISNKCVTVTVGLSAFCTVLEV